MRFSEIFRVSVIALALSVLPAIALYAAGYVTLSKQSRKLYGCCWIVNDREFPCRLLAEIYRPAAQIESALTADAVETSPTSGPLLFSR